MKLKPRLFHSDKGETREYINICSFTEIPDNGEHGRDKIQKERVHRQVSMCGKTIEYNIL